ncbi:uncharacterized protein BDR25DRAFT_346666 [Lindgomyces ingoldianus]|uniref:Uncharacterized protein n=1 Tax=Lindgomyces ingoldianus TaxID=673940 RepID=A0ACB6QE65_9PLEO|nr:uncharacterized protein BDR25DRAFT_346666 [Lindgomyces ingoldianus]KAF2464436.1 hypothetical protein BDR25DRAFT_346666 [Lindgomyces ingoldianus]
MSKNLETASKKYAQLNIPQNPSHRLPLCLPRTSLTLPTTHSTLRSQLVVIKTRLYKDEVAFLEAIRSNIHISGSERIGGMLIDKGDEIAPARYSWAALEPVFGQDLFTLSTRRKVRTFPASLVAHIFIEVLEAIRWLHGLNPKGIFHGDIGNPANIMLEMFPRAGGLRVLGLPNVVMVDFGAGGWCEDMDGAVCYDATEFRGLMACLANDTGDRFLHGIVESYACSPDPSPDEIWLRWQEEATKRRGDGPFVVPEGLLVELGKLVVSDEAMEAAVEEAITID